MLRKVELEERSVVSAAHELGISPGNASVRLFRARRALLGRLRATCGACMEHGCLDCWCRDPHRPGLTTASGSVRPADLVRLVRDGSNARREPETREETRK